ncbi:MAG: delta-60 repeat domain-containing protein, partial [candidate division WOR-3 bacterium]
IGGESDSYGSGSMSWNVTIFKLNSDGSLSWKNEVGGTAWDDLTSVIQCPNGDYIGAGYTLSFGSGGWDGAVFRWNSVGTLLWMRTFGGSSDDMLFSVVTTPDEGCIVAGYTRSYGAGGSDFLILKLNSDGTTAWARTFGGPNDEEAVSVIRTSDGGYAVVGHTRSYGAGGYDFLFLKLNSDGSFAWARTYGGPRDETESGESAPHLIQNPDNSYVIAGETTSFGVGNSDLLVLKLNPDGSIVWARTWGGTGSDGMHGSVVQTSDQCYAITGYTGSFGTGGDCFVLKVDPNGNYPSCVQPCSPSTMSVTLSISTPSVGASAIPNSVTWNPTTIIPSLATTNVCAPIELNELDASGSKPENICSTTPGGLLFFSSDVLELKIYTGSGNMIYWGNLQKGQTRISLKQGVYLWMAGPYRGKAVVR